MHPVQYNKWEVVEGCRLPTEFLFISIDISDEIIFFEIIYVLENQTHLKGKFGMIKLIWKTL